MASVGTIEVSLKASGSAQFIANLQMAADKLKDVGGAGEKTSSSLDGLASMAKKAAAIFGLWKTVEVGVKFAEMADGAKDARAVFDSLGGSLNGLRTATQGMISDAELVSRSNMAQQMGLTGSQFKNLSEIALAAANKTGNSVDHMMDAIVTGTAKGSEMALKQAGIWVDTESANIAYATSIGTTADKLSEGQKRQALFNEVMAQGRDMLDELATAGVGLSNPFEQFKTSVSNASGVLGNSLLPIIRDVMEDMTPLVEEVATFAKELMDSVVPAARSARDEFKDAFSELTGGQSIVQTMKTSFKTLADMVAAAGESVAYLMHLNDKFSGTDKFNGDVWGQRLASIKQFRAELQGASTDSMSIDGIGKPKAEGTRALLRMDAFVMPAFRGKESSESARKEMDMFANAQRDILKQQAAAYGDLQEKLFSLTREADTASSAFPSIRQVAISAADRLRDMYLAAEKAGAVFDVSAVRDQIGGLAAREMAAKLSQIKDQSEFNKATRFAAVEAELAGIKWSDVVSAISRPQEISDAMPEIKSMSDLVGPSIKKMVDDLAVELGASLRGVDRREITSTITSSLSDLIGDGRLDFTKIGQAFGKMMGGTEIGGEIFSDIGKAVGISNKTANQGGGIGMVLGGVAGGVAGAVVPMVIEVFKTIVDALRQVPQMIVDAVTGLVDLLPLGDVGTRIKDAFTPMVVVVGMVTGALAVLGAPLMLLASTVAAVLFPVVLALAQSFIMMLPLILATVGALGLIAAAAISFATGVAMAVLTLVSMAAMVVVSFGTLAAAAVMAFTPIQIAVALLAVAAAPVIVLFAALAASMTVAVGMFAMLGAFVKMLGETKSFERFKKAIEASIGRIVQALEPFMDRMMAFAGLFDALVSVVIPLAQAFANNEIAARILFDVFKSMAIGAGIFVVAIGVFISAILAVGIALTELGKGIGFILESFAAAIGLINQVFKSESLRTAYDDMTNAASRVNTGMDTASAAMTAMSPNVNDMAAAVRDLMGLTFEEATARGKTLAMEKAAAESMTNVPQGFKVAAERFRAISAEDMSSGVLGGERVPGQGGTNFIIQNMEVLADDAGEFAESMQRRAERARLQQAGTTGTSDGQNNGG